MGRQNVKNIQKQAKFLIVLEGKLGEGGGGDFSAKGPEKSTDHNRVMQREEEAW